MLTSSVFLEFRLAREEEGLAPFGAGVSVGKFLEFRLAGEVGGGGEGGGCLPKLGAGVSVGKFLEFRLAGEGEGGGLFTSRCRCARRKIPGIPSGGGGGCRCARGKIPGIPSGGGGGRGGGCLQVGAGVSVGKFLAVTLNGARVSVGKILCGDLEWCTCGRANS